MSDVLKGMLAGGVATGPIPYLDQPIEVPIGQLPAANIVSWTYSIAGLVSVTPEGMFE